MKQTSGFESLLDALKQSGMDMGGFGGQSSAGGQGGQTGSSGGQGAGNPFAGSPFSGFGGFGGGHGHGGHDDSGGGEQFSFSESFGKMSRKAIVVSIILVVVIAAIAYWWFHPPINIHSVDTWMFVSVFILLPLFLVWRAKART